MEYQKNQVAKPIETQYLSDYNVCVPQTMQWFYISLYQTI